MFSALSGEVPLVGRGELLAGVEEAIRGDDFYGTFVYGDTGTGKSVLARHLLVALEGEFVPFLITPAPALSSIPYGALTPFLGHATTEDMQSPLSVLRTTLTFLRSAAEGRPIVVILDDAHLLDDDSSHLLAQLVTSRTIRLVAFSRSTAAESDELVSLCRDGLLARFDLGALDHTEAMMLCSIVLDGAIVRGSSERLRDEAAGNPLFLKAILDEALSSGALVRKDGVWLLTNQDPALPASLVDLVRVATLDFDEDQRRTFEVLALGERVPFADLIRVGSETAVSRLLQDGLIDEDPRDPAFAVVRYPLYGRIVRSMIPVGRSAALHRNVKEGAVGLPMSVRAQIRDALWSLDCGEQVEDRRLLDLCRRALRLLDATSALRLSEAVRGPELSWSARVCRATALFESARRTEVHHLVDGCLDNAESPEDVTAAGVLEIRQIVASGGDVASTEGVVDRWADALRRLSDAVPAPSAEPGTPPGALPGGDGDRPFHDAIRQSDQHRVLARAYGSNLSGRYADSEESLRRLLDGGSRDTRTLVLAHSLLAEALGVLGRGLEGRQHSAMALAVVETDPEGLFDLHRVAYFRHVSLLIHAGDFEASMEALLEYAPAVGRDYTFISGSMAVLDAAADVRRGQFRAGLDKLRPALTALRIADDDALLPYALGIMAWAAAAVGDTDTARHSLTELGDVGRRGSRLFALLARALGTAAEGLMGDAGAAGRLLDLAEEARKGRWISCEKDILELATFLGSEEAAEFLRNVTGSAEGAEAAVLNAYARALIAHDAAALAAAGDRAELVQKHLLATEACRQAMEVYAGAGDARSQRALAPVIRRRRALIDGGTHLQQSDLDGVAPLTTREKEIASLAVQGLSNRDIARRLTVSTRTVEGHLYRIYVKLGISRREDLISELESLLDAM